MKNKKSIFLFSLLLCVGLFLGLGIARAQSSGSQDDYEEERREQIELRGWSDEDVTGAWEVVLRSYISLAETEGVSSDDIEMIEELNRVFENKRVIQRFSDEVYNHFEPDSGGENLIYDKVSDKLFVYITGEYLVHVFSTEQYQTKYLGMEEGSSIWPDSKSLSEPQSPILGFEVTKVQVQANTDSTATDLSAEDSNVDEDPSADDLSFYWVTPELPTWFYKLKGISLPGYPLQWVQKANIDNLKLNIHVEVAELRPIDPEELILTPPEELEVISGISSDSVSAKSDIELAQLEFLKEFEESEPVIYDGLSPFHGGMARVEKQGQSFYIDTQGELIFDFKLATVLAHKQFSPEAGDQSGQGAQGLSCYQPNHYDEDVVENLIVSRDGKFGLISGVDGQWLIPPTYDLLEKRTCQMLKTYKGEQQGLSTVWGQELVPAEFDKALYFGFEQFFAVQKDELWGVFDARTQELVIPIELQAIDYCAGCDIKPKYFYAQKGDQWGLLDFKGNAVLPFDYEFSRHQNMRSDLWVTNLLKAGEPVLIHLDTGAHYSLNEFEDVVLLSDFIVLRKNGLFALLNGSGQQITDFELSGFHELSNFEGEKDYIEVIKGAEKAILDGEGTVIVPWVQAKAIYRLRKDFFVVNYGEGRHAELLDLTGAQLIPDEYSSYSILTFRGEPGELVDSNVIRVESDELQGWYSLDEKVLVESAFDEIFYEQLEGTEQAFIEVHKDNKKGLYALDGTELIPPIYDYLRFIGPDLLVFSQDSGSGLIDFSTGNEQLEARYVRIEPFRSGRLLSLMLPQDQQHDSFYHWWDTEQKQIVELPFKVYEPMTEDGLWHVRKDGHSYLYDANDEKIISGPYDYMKEEHNDFIIVEKDELLGVINTKGDEIHAPEYKTVEMTDSGFFVLSQLNTFDFWETYYLTPSGEQVFSKPIVTRFEPDYLVREADQMIFISVFDPVKRTDRLGAYGWDGTQYLEPQHDTLILHEQEPRYAVIDSFNAGLFDSQGNEIFPVILDDVFYEQLDFFGGSIKQKDVEFPLLASIDRKYFYIDEDGGVLPVIGGSLANYEE